MSARKYYSTADLEKDARFWRRREDELRRRALTENNPSQTLRKANTAKLRAEASETILVWRLNNLK